MWQRHTKHNLGCLSIVHLHPGSLVPSSCRLRLWRHTHGPRAQPPILVDMHRSNAMSSGQMMSPGNSTSYEWCARHEKSWCGRAGQHSQDQNGLWVPADCRETSGLCTGLSPWRDRQIFLRKKVLDEDWWRCMHNVRLVRRHQTRKKIQLHFMFVESIFEDCSSAVTTMQVPNHGKEIRFG